MTALRVRDCDYAPLTEYGRWRRRLPGLIIAEAWEELKRLGGEPLLPKGETEARTRKATRIVAGKTETDTARRVLSKVRCGHPECLEPPTP